MYSRRNHLDAHELLAGVPGVHVDADLSLGRNVQLEIKSCSAQTVIGNSFYQTALMLISKRGTK